MLKIRLFVFLIPCIWITIHTSGAFPVSLEFFEGIWNSEARAVELEFGTGSEVDHAAFHVWRSWSNIPPEFVNSSNAQRLTSVPIMGENACNAGSGSYYLYEDITVSFTEDVYYYYLESLSCTSSDSEFYGSISALNSGLPVVNPNVPPDKRLYMPLIHGEAP